ncbi:MAG: hypothetical protein U1C46_10885 [Bacteroidales bacterium]|nr:hypothetical protein [Bacteroidales bacterium]MDZ4205306.1 hypothetical protein [Bacteroidales bacterium]
MAPVVKRFTIPIFIPMQGYPFACVFCNQRNITGQYDPPGDELIIDKIEDHLRSIPVTDTGVELGFFGGSFAGLSYQKQVHYLELVKLILKANKSLVFDFQPGLIM